MSPFSSATVALTAVGLFGVLVLAVTASRETLALIPIRNAFVKRLALAAQPAVLLFLCVLGGVATADIAGTRSLIGEWAAGYDARWELLERGGIIIVGGIALGFLLLLADRLTKRIWAPAGGGPDLASDWKPSALLAGLVYGGITEEVMMRWGIMNIVLWGLVRLTDGTSGNPEAGLVIAAIAISSLVFAAGHLPAAFAGGFRGRGFVVRTLVLNFIAGVVFGWLFAAIALEAAMLAHAAFHIGVAILAVGLRIGGRRVAT